MKKSKFSEAQIGTGLRSSACGRGAHQRRDRLRHGRSWRPWRNYRLARAAATLSRRLGRTGKRDVRRVRPERGQAIPDGAAWRQG